MNRSETYRLKKQILDECTRVYNAINKNMTAKQYAATPWLPDMNQWCAHVEKHTKSKKQKALIAEYRLLIERLKPIQRRLSMRLVA